MMAFIELDIKILEGLPPYGPTAVPIPPKWGRVGREGIVVEFATDVATWVGNFQPGLEGVTFAHRHPNGLDAVVIAAGDLWAVNVEQRTAELVLPAIDSALKVQEPDGWILSRQGLALARFGPAGVLWHSKRLSWDGFNQLSYVRGEVQGLAWSPLDGHWHPFKVDANTGRSMGGSFGDDDSENWERLADA